MVWRFGGYQYFRWKVPHREAEAIVGAILLMVPLTIVSLSLIGASDASLRSHPKALELPETFLPLYILSATNLVATCVVIAHIKERNSKQILFVGRLLWLLGSYLLVIYSLALIPVTRLLWETKSLKNLGDANVDLLKTFYLAAYHGCCFEANESPPALDCESRNQIEPCYLNEDLFQEIISDPDLRLNSAKCSNLGGLDLNHRNQDGELRPTRGNCPEGERRFLTKPVERAYKLSLSSIVVALVVGYVSIIISSYLIMGVLYLR